MARHDERFKAYEIAQPVSYDLFSRSSAEVDPPGETAPKQRWPSETEIPKPDLLPKANEYEIVQPLSYDTPSTSPATASPAETHRETFREPWEDEEHGGEIPLTSGGETPGAEEVAKFKREERAIWVVHGMGQQIPFETLDDLTQGVLKAAAERGQKPPLRLRTVKLGSETIQRVEMDVDGRPNQAGKTPHYNLHLYECYWAPKTEGVAKLQDVVSFLLDGGSRGLLNSVQKFGRAMFPGRMGGRLQQFKIPKRTPFLIFVTLLVFAALVAINGVIVAAGAAKIAPGLAAPSLNQHWKLLTAFANYMTAVAFAFGILLFLAEFNDPALWPKCMKMALSAIVWLALSGTVIVTIGTGVVMVLATRLDWAPVWFQDDPGNLTQIDVFGEVMILVCLALVALAMARRASLRSSGAHLRGDPLLVALFGFSFLLHFAALVGPFWLLERHTLGLPAGKWVPSYVWVWPVLIWLSAQIRTILVEYMGDVAIYVTPNKLDRFDDVRNAIKALARNIASALYLACKPGTQQFLYKKIAVVGHSLGSVIAYDTLNRLMLDDWLSGNLIGIAQRTNSLVTFGSPLDKTAFLFTIQGKNALHVRERLAATVQPLIESYRTFRKFDWVNVYSHNDIISGELKFYDLPGNPVPPGVKNLIDEDACVPLVAHVDYWKNITVWRELLDRIAP